MELGYFKGNVNNVGDDLNPFLWNKIFNNIGSDKNKVFIGIGSVLDNRFDLYTNKLVFGAGARGKSSLPIVDDSWDFRFVRGPRTANVLNEIGVKCPYITDPAILISNFFEKKNNAIDIGLVPYFRSNVIEWQKIADKLGYKLISPTLSVEEFMYEISSCKLVLTEAMHGAIIADSLRIPWLSYSSFTIAHEEETHLFKWSDWAESMELKFVERTLPILWPILDNTVINRVKTYIKKNVICWKLALFVKDNQQQLSDISVFKTKLAQIELQIELINDISKI